MEAAERELNEATPSPDANSLPRLPAVVDKTRVTSTFRSRPRAEAGDPRLRALSTLERSVAASARGICGRIAGREGVDPRLRKALYYASSACGPSGVVNGRCRLRVEDQDFMGPAHPITDSRPAIESVTRIGRWLTWNLFIRVPGRVNPKLRPSQLPSKT